MLYDEIAGEKFDKVQELKQQNDQLKSENDLLKSENVRLKSEIDLLKSGNDQPEQRSAQVVAYNKVDSIDVLF